MNTESRAPAVGGERRYEKLSEAECMDLLTGAVIGRIGFSAYSVASIRPVNFVVDDRAVVFRSAAGAKIGPALRRSPVCFEVDHFDPAMGTGWSVIVTGLTGLIHDPERIARIDRVLSSWMPGALGHLMSIEIEQVTGRRIA
jgi:nitroimidazol reductase NimA-like FMN-containing flavoprotein (pyridoxamine 5'-phosphate oxidase superfamily)